MEVWRQKADEFLSDNFIEPFASERFDANRFISEMINQSSVENIIDLITQLEARERSLDAFFRALCETNPDFVENQFALPQTMATLFDTINTELQQNNRRVAQAKSFLNFNSEQLRTLTEEIRVLRSFNEGLQQIETLNDMMIEFSIYMKRGLLWDSAKICRRIDIKIKLFRDSVGRDNTILISATEYFARQLKTKKEELFYILREELYRLLYEGLIERVDTQNFSLWTAEAVDDPTTPIFLIHSPLYEFFEDGIINDFTLPPVSLDNLSSLHTRLSQSHQIHTALTELLFDSDIFSIIRTSLSDNFAVDLQNEPKIFEVMSSTREAMLQEKLFSQLPGSIDNKIPIYIAKTLRFFIFTVQNHQFWAGAESSEGDDLTGIDSILSLGSHFCRAITVFLQRLTIVLKAGEQKKPSFIFTIFEKILDHFKYTMERLLAPSEERRATDDLSTALGQLRAFLPLSPTTYFILTAQFQLHLSQTMERTAILLDLPRLGEQFGSLMDIIGQYLTSLFIGRVERGFETQVVSNKRLEEFSKFEIKAVEADPAGFTERLTGNAAYSAFLLQKKTSIELYTVYRSFFRSLSISLITATSHDQAVNNKLFNLGNKLLGHFVNLHNQRFMNHPIFQSCSDLRLPYWKDLRQHVIFQLAFVSKEEIFKDDIPVFEQPPRKNFWNSTEEFEFYEKAFIALGALYSFFIELRTSVLCFWSHQPEKNLQPVAVFLGVSFSFDNRVVELYSAHRTAQSQGLNLKLKEKFRTQSLTFEENFLLFLLILFDVGDIIANVFLHLKYNFDLMLSSFFGLEEQMLPLGAPLVLKSIQIHEFRSLLLSFDRLFARYMPRGELAQLFRTNSLRLFYARLHDHLVQQSSCFVVEEKTLRAYYFSFRDVLEASSVFGECKAEIQVFTAEYLQVFKETETPDNAKID